MVDSRIRVGNTFKFYRELQLLGLHENICFQYLFLPTLLCGFSVELIIAIFACIRLHDQFYTSPALGSFPMSMFNTIVIIISLGTTAAGVRSKSTDLVQKLRNIGKKGRNTWVRKVAKSIAPLAVRFSSNYVDKETPLLILDICIQQAVSILIASE